MGLIETIIIILIVVISVFTLVREPTLSIKYYKAFGKTAVSGIVWIKDTVQNMAHKDKPEVRENLHQD